MYVIVCYRTSKNCKVNNCKKKLDMEVIRGASNEHCHSVGANLNTLKFIADGQKLYILDGFCYCSIG